MTFWQASLDTRKFSFEAYGHRKSDALMALGDLLRVHGEQYDLEENWCSDWMEDIVYREIELNVGYRDRSEVSRLMGGIHLSDPDSFKGAKGPRDT